MGPWAKAIAQDLRSFYLRPEDQVFVIDVPSELAMRNFAGNPICGPVAPPLAPCADLPGYLAELEDTFIGAWEPMADAFAALPTMVQWRTNSTKRVLIVTDEPYAPAQQATIQDNVDLARAEDYMVYVYAGEDYGTIPRQSKGRALDIDTPIRSPCQP